MQRAPIVVVDPWSSTPGGGAAPESPWRRRGQSAALTAPLLGAAVASRSLGGPTALTAGLGAGALVALAVCWRRPELTAGLERRAGSVVRTAASVVAGVILAPVVVVVLYLPGAIGSFVRWLRRRGRPSSTLLARSVSTATERRLAMRPFAPTPERVRWERNIGGAVLLAAALVVLVVAAGDHGEPAPVRPGEPEARASEVRPDADIGPTQPFAPRDAPPTPYTSLPSYAGSDFADELQREQQQFAYHLPPDPVTGIASGSFDGRFTHVVDGVRRTRPSTCERCPTVRLWLVGGSSAFGLGQRDEGTIASHLVELAAADGVDLELTNLAVPGWTIWQESQAVGRRLSDPTTVPPDLVVSLGGYNDGAAALVGVVSGRPMRSPLVLDFDEVGRFAGSGLRAADGGGARHLGRQAAEAYRSSAAAITAAAAAHGAVARFFFQPDAMASLHQFEPVRIAVRGLNPGTVADFDQVLDTMATELRPDTVDLRHVFDDEPRSVFVDIAHTNEEGAALVADAMYPSLRDDLLARAG